MPTRKTPVAQAATEAVTVPAKKAAAPAPAATSASRPAAKPAAKLAKAPKEKKPAADEKAPRMEKEKEKEKKPKLVRDSFTIPKAEYAVLDTLKQRAATLGTPAKKSELLRAGLMALAAMDDGALAAQLGRVPAVKTGRPPKA